ncbi:Hok/Gef family protein [Aliivibrio fischeri]|nr:Hok/Gef family protein [Aliivibrio fischeri]
MQKKSTLASLIVICVTILIGIWLLRDSLCDVSYLSEGTIITATLAYESR